jgi:predicted dehydrogenase
VLLTSGAIERVSMLQELHSAAKANGVVVGFGDRLVHHRGHQLIAGRLKENALGKLHHLRFLIARQPLLPKVWRHEPAFARWGVLATHGADVAALVYELLKSYKPRCEKVYVDVAVDGHGFDRTVHGLLRVPEGPTIELTLSDLFNGPSRFEIFGENGTITAQGTLEGASQGKIEGVRGPFIYTGVDLAVGRLRSFVKAALEERLEAGTMLRSRFVAEFLNLLYSGGPQNDDTQADESSGGNGAYEFEDEPREQTSPQLDLPLEPVVSANEDTDASASVTTSPPSENVAQDESEGEGETIVDDEVVEPMPDVDDQ